MPDVAPTTVGDLMAAAEQVAARHAAQDELHLAAVQDAADEAARRIESINTESAALD